MKNNIQLIKTITYAAVYFALIMIMSFIPFTGFIYIAPGFKITTIGIIVVIATWHIGFVGSLTTAFGFALGSFISGAIYPSLLGAFFYENPWIAFVPRILVGLFIWITVKLLKEFKPWKFVLSVSLGALYNTAFVLGAIMLVNEGSKIGLIVLANIGIEAILIPAISPLFIKMVQHLISGYQQIAKDSW